MLRASAAALAVVSLAACGTNGSTQPSAGTPEPSPTATPSATPKPTKTAPPVRPTPSGRPILGSAPPPWLGKRVLPRRPDGYGEMRPTPPQLVQRRFTLPDTVASLPGTGFAARVSTPAPADVIARSTWAPGCPVAATDLSWLRLTFRGFDGRRHTGELLVNKAVAEDVVGVFRRLYADRFPIEEMRITTKPEQTAPPTGDGNDTGSFNCRATRGATFFSQHAYALAVDVNPFQNPYHKGAPPSGVVLPELASSYLDRSWVRPGMITADGPVVRAFAAIGWTWGGTWHSLQDLQHFSRNGR
jgi:hypothetical protein